MYTALRQGFSLRACHSAQAHFLSLLPADCTGPLGCKKQVRKCKDRLTRKLVGRLDLGSEATGGVDRAPSGFEPRQQSGWQKQECALELSCVYLGLLVCLMPFSECLIAYF